MTTASCQVVLSIAHFRLTCTLSKMGRDDVNNANGKEKESLLPAVQWNNFFPNERNKRLARPRMLLYRFSTTSLLSFHH